MENLLLAEALRESELLMDCRDDRFSLEFCEQMQLLVDLYQPEALLVGLMCNGDVWSCG